MLDRLINVENLDENQLENAINVVSKKINLEVDETCDRVNKLLSRYGLCCKMQIVIEELNTSQSDIIKQDNGVL